MKRLLAVAVLAFGLALVSLIVTLLVTLVYPGAYRFTAPILCPSEQPDAFVVQYSVASTDGNSTNITLFCADERGEFTEVGSWRPLGLLTGYVAAGLVVILLILLGWVRLRRSRREGMADLSGQSAPLPGGGVGLPDDVREEALGFIAQNKAIAAVKAVRDGTGLGLREAKEAVDALRDGT